MPTDSGQPQAAPTAVRASAQTPALIDPGAEISSTAYALYEARGCGDGHALDDWLEAEARVRRGDGAVEVDKGRTAIAG